MRSAIRFLTGAPGLATLAVLAIAIGVGAPAAMFSIVHGLMRDLPVPRGERIVYLLETDSVTGERDMGLSLNELLALRRAQRSLDDVAGFAVETFGVASARGGGAPQRYSGARITADGFRLLSVRAALGSTFGEDAQTGGAHDVVISDAMWRARFGADSGLVGKPIRVNGETVRVRGVMPPGFRFPLSEDLWLPLALTPTATSADDRRDLHAFGRLRDGVAVAEARADIARVWATVRVGEGQASRSVATRVVPYRESQIEPEDFTIFGAMLAVVSLVLLLACANVANLLLVRAAARAHELAVKRALGASSGAIAREFFAESVVVSVLGGAAGVAAAWLGVRAFNIGIQHATLPFWMTITVDRAVLAWALALTGAAAVLAGIGPAVQAARVDAASALKQTARGSTWLRIARVTRVLVIGEMALSCALLVVAGLVTAGILTETRGALSFSPAGFVTARIDAPSGAYSDAAKRRVADALLARLASSPDVARAAIVSTPPGIVAADTRLTFEGRTYARADEAPRARVNVVTRGFFDMFSAEAIAGRTFDASDRAGAPPVAVVNESFVRRHAARGEPIVGRRVRVAGFGDSTWVTVVGVVRDVGTVSRGPQFNEVIYLSYDEFPQSTMHVVVKGRGGAGSLTRAVQTAVRDVDPALPVEQPSTLSADLSAAHAAAEAFAALFGILGIAGLVVASVGLFGVVAFTVRQRIPELGIRSALGATPVRLVLLLLRGTGAQLVVGVAAGLALAAVIAPRLAGFLFGGNPFDARVYLGVAALLAMVATWATLGPAMRAARGSIVAALRLG